MKNPATVRWATLFWAAVTALFIEDRFSLAWWHPYCANQADGPGYEAYGFPFPYRQYTGVSSMEDFFMPHVYVLNLVLLAAIAYPVLLLFFRRGARWWAASGKWAAWSGLFIVILFAADDAIAGYWTLRPVSTIGASRLGYADDTYFAYRPAFLVARQRKKPCTSPQLQLLAT